MGVGKACVNLAGFRIISSTTESQAAVSMFEIIVDERDRTMFVTSTSVRIGKRRPLDEPTLERGTKLVQMFQHSMLFYAEHVSKAPTYFLAIGDALLVASAEKGAERSLSIPYTGNSPLRVVAIQAKNKKNVQI